MCVTTIVDMTVTNPSPLPLPLPPPPPFASDWALFLDVDGTLLDFADTPEAVQVAPGLVALLGTLHRQLDGALGLVSGRPLAQLDALFTPLRLPGAGLHGLERRSDQAHLARYPVPPALDALRHNAEALALAYPGSLVEDKGPSLALHWRGNRHAAPALQALASAALRSLPGYSMQPGDHVLELRPQGADKGTAIEALLASAPFRGRRPVFIGDDHTDEHGFEIVEGLGGIAVLVGARQPSIARHGLPDPEAVRGWLHEAASRRAIPARSTRGHA